MPNAQFHIILIIAYMLLAIIAGSVVSFIGQSADIAFQVFLGVLVVAMASHTGYFCLQLLNLFYEGVGVVEEKTDVLDEDIRSIRSTFQQLGDVLETVFHSIDQIQERQNTDRELLEKIAQSLEQHSFTLGVIAQNKTISNPSEEKNAPVDRQDTSHHDHFEQSEDNSSDDKQPALNSLLNDDDDEFDSIYYKASDAQNKAPTDEEFATPVNRQARPTPAVKPEVKDPFDTKDPFKKSFKSASPAPSTPVRPLYDFEDEIEPPIGFSKSAPTPQPSSSAVSGSSKTQNFFDLEDDDDSFFEEVPHAPHEKHSSSIRQPVAEIEEEEAFASVPPPRTVKQPVHTPPPADPVIASASPAYQPRAVVDPFSEDFADEPIHSGRTAQKPTPHHTEPPVLASSIPESNPFEEDDEFLMANDDEGEDEFVTISHSVPDNHGSTNQLPTRETVRTPAPPPPVSQPADVPVSRSVQQEIFKEEDPFESPFPVASQTSTHQKNTHSSSEEFDRPSAPPPPSASVPPKRPVERPEPIDDFPFPAIPKTGMKSAPVTNDLFGDDFLDLNEPSAPPKTNRSVDTGAGSTSGHKDKKQSSDEGHGFDNEEEAGQKSPSLGHIRPLKAVPLTSRRVTTPPAQSKEPPAQSSSFSNEKSPFARPPVEKASPKSDADSDDDFEIPEARYAPLDVLRYAMKKNKVDLFLQPIVEFQTRETCFFEGFSRIRNPRDEYVLPEDYMEPAIKSGLIAPIDNLMLIRSVQIVRGLHEQGQSMGMFCNISNQSLEDHSFLEEFLNIIQERRNLARHIIFEINQAAFKAMTPDAWEIISQVIQMGFTLSLDNVEDWLLDFDLLTARGVRYLKIKENVLLGGIADKGVKLRPADIRPMLNDHNIMLIVEKVETEETYNKIAAVGGCDYVQGYLFGTPKVASSSQFQ